MVRWRILPLLIDTITNATATGCQHSYCCCCCCYLPPVLFHRVMLRLRVMRALALPSSLKNASKAAKEGEKRIGQQRKEKCKEREEKGKEKDR